MLNHKKATLLQRPWLPFFVAIRNPIIAYYGLCIGHLPQQTLNLLHLFPQIEGCTRTVNVLSIHPAAAANSCPMHARISFRSRTLTRSCTSFPFSVFFRNIYHGHHGTTYIIHTTCTSSGTSYSLFNLSYPKLYLGAGLTYIFLTILLRK